jgi:hypothetical protein
MQDMIEPYDPRHRTDKTLADVRGAYERMCRRLGRDGKQALDAIVVDGRLPSWFRRLELGQAMQRKAKRCSQD